MASLPPLAAGICLLLASAPAQTAEPTAPAAPAPAPAPAPAEPADIEAEPVSVNRGIPWETWIKLQPADAELEPGGLSLRADCDAEAVYLRFQIEPWMSYSTWAENRPAWRIGLSLQDAADPSKTYLRLDLEDDGRTDTALENGVRLLETAEDDGSHRIELRIPRLLLGEALPWNADGPAVALGVVPKFELGNWLQPAAQDPALLEVVEVDDEGNPIELPEGAQANGDPQGKIDPWPAGNRFSLGWFNGAPVPGVLAAFEG